MLSSLYSLLERSCTKSTRLDGMSASLELTICLQTGAGDQRQCNS